MNNNKFNEIVSGWKNFLFKNEAAEELAKKRLEICVSNHNQNEKCLTDRNFCTNCGCFIPAKVRSEKSHCPKGKW